MRTVTERRFYVYAYLRTDGTPYYIGKGTGKRIDRAHRFRLPPKAQRKVLVEDLTEVEAFDYEQHLIALLGRKAEGGCLINLTEGGEGPTGMRHTDETKAKISRIHKGKTISEEQRKAQSDSTRGVPQPQWLIDKRAAALRGHRHSEDTKLKIGAASRGRRFSEDTKKVMSEKAAARWTADVHAKTAHSRKVNTAAKYGVVLDDYLKLTTKQNNLLRARFCTGKRGAELVKNLPLALS
jgi:hypothetical protein